MDDEATLIGHDDQVGDRIEGVFQLTSRARHIVEQLQIFDNRRQLRAKFVGPLEQVEFAARIDADAHEDDRTEGATETAQRHRQNRG
jgi:hypothetical protein